MARRKTPPSTLQTKHILAERIMALRIDLFGPRGGPELARRLGIPVRTWYNYEGGITVPGEIVLKIIEVTSVEPAWLLHGTGPRFSGSRNDASETPTSPVINATAMVTSALKRDLPASSSVAVCILLRAALRLLENDQAPVQMRNGTAPKPVELDGEPVMVDSESQFSEWSTHQNSRSAGNGIAH